MTENVLVTGGFGLVGSQTVRRLAADGHRVVATDLGTAAQRKAAESLPAGAEAQLGGPDRPRLTVDRLVAETAPTAIIHLAAVIPPAIYRHPELARRVNVDATAALLRAAQSSPRPVRFVQASSNAVHGSRNPHRHRELVARGHPAASHRISTAPTRSRPRSCVRASGLEWVILRLAGVMSVEPGAMPLSMRRTLLRKRAADRRAYSHRRRPRRRGRVRGRDHRRCRR